MIEDPAVSAAWSPELAASLGPKDSDDNRRISTPSNFTLDGEDDDASLPGEDDDPVLPGERGGGDEGGRRGGR